nr:hypothetical protein [Tanacetum cinerariifolium]
MKQVVSEKDQEQYWSVPERDYRYIPIKKFADIFRSYRVGKNLVEELSVVVFLTMRYVSVSVVLSTGFVFCSTGIFYILNLLDSAISLEVLSGTENGVEYLILLRLRICLLLEETSSCIDLGPQLPTHVTIIVKPGINLLQVVGKFDALNASTHLSKELCANIFRLRLDLMYYYSLRLLPLRRFDFDNYVDINSRRPLWRCPLCGQSVCFTDIRIDQGMVKLPAHAIGTSSTIMNDMSHGQSQSKRQSQMSASNMQLSTQLVLSVVMDAVLEGPSQTYVSNHMQFQQHYLNSMRNDQSGRSAVSEHGLTG